MSIHVVSEILDRPIQYVSLAEMKHVFKTTVIVYVYTLNLKH